MHIQFTPLAAVPGLLACGWCGGTATDAADHARWHWRNEGRSAGDASATGPSYGVGEPLEIAVGPAAPAAPGYGAVLTEDQAVAHGLLPAVGDMADLAFRAHAHADGSHPFPAPVHAVPVRSYQSQPSDIGPQPLTDPVTGVRRPLVDPVTPRATEQEDRARSAALDADLIREAEQRPE